MTTYRPGGALAIVVIEPATMPDEIVQVKVDPVGSPVRVQLVSYGLNPLPETPTEKPGNTMLGLMVIFADGVPTWKVAPAKYMFESVTLTT